MSSDIPELGLEGKTCLITGSSQGIGAAVARLLGSLGVKIVIHYFSNPTKAEEVAAEIESAGGTAVIIQQNLSDVGGGRQLIRQALAAAGGLDILINNAGNIFSRVPITDVDDNYFDQVVNLNIRAVVDACSEVVVHFRKQGYGNIINTSSSGARNGGGTCVTLYAGAKGFINTFTRGLANELVNDNIRVNAVAPGITATALQGPEYTSPEYLEKVEKMVPMGRIGLPDECAGAYLYLASERLSSYVTGQVIEVNGGLCMP